MERVRLEVRRSHHHLIVYALSKLTDSIAAILYEQQAKAGGDCRSVPDKERSIPAIAASCFCTKWTHWHAGDQFMHRTCDRLTPVREPQRLTDCGIHLVVAWPSVRLLVIAHSACSTLEGIMSVTRHSRDLFDEIHHGLHICGGIEEVYRVTEQVVAKR